MSHAARLHSSPWLADHSEGLNAMSLLLKLHEIAAQRGDGLRPELLAALRREACAPSGTALGLAPYAALPASVPVMPAASSSDVDHDREALADETVPTPHLPAL
jgi:hypothetical protein